VPNLSAEARTAAETLGKPTRTTPSDDVSGPSTGAERSGSRMRAMTGEAAASAADALFDQAMNQLAELAEQNGDKDLAATADAINKGREARDFIQNPTQFLAGKVKAALIQGPFNHFSKTLNAQRQWFEEKFPDVGIVHKDVLAAGVSLEDHKNNYDKALAALRVPDARKALYYVAVLWETNENTPKEEVDWRIAVANRELAKLPSMARYVERYKEARSQYGLALFSVNYRLGLRLDEWAKQPADLADGIRRRGEALDHASRVLDDAYRQLWENGFIVWPPVLALAGDLQTLAEGFHGVARQFRGFADVTGRRKGEYDRELIRLQAESDRIDDSDKVLGL
jgi:hypothetical protein